MSHTFRNLLFSLAALLASTVNPALAQQDQAAPESNPKNWPWLAQVAGSCWRGELAPGETVDTQCFSLQFGKVIRVSQSIDTYEKTRKVSTLDASSVYAWDARQKKFRHVFWASDGSFESARGGADGNALTLFLDREVGTDGTAPVRTVLRMLDVDHYKASREELREGVWKELFSFIYSRLQNVNQPK